MKRYVWQVSASPPSVVLGDWPWPTGYFPRQYYYKTEAQRVIGVLKKYNARNVVLTKVDRTKL